MVTGTQRSLWQIAKTWWNTYSTNPLKLMPENKAVSNVYGIPPNKGTDPFKPFQCLDYFCSKHNDAKIFENHLNPVILVFIR